MAKRSKKGLGVGALLSGINTNIEEDKKDLVVRLSNTIMEIPLAQIEANPVNPRVEFEAEALQQLSESIKLHGLIQPITVRHLSENKFQLISGERRLRASKLAGLESIPAYIRVADDDQILEMALIENIQRQDLNAIEIATTYERLMDELKLTHETLSKRVGKKRSTVTNYLRLLKLPATIQQALQSEEASISISMGHARALVNIEDADLQSILYKTVLDESLSVRKLEAYVKALNKSLPELVNAVKSGLLKPVQVEIITQLPDIVLQLNVFKEVVSKQLTVDDTQKLVEALMQNQQESNNSKSLSSKKELSDALKRVQNGLKSQLGAKVNLKVDKKGKGQIVINFSDNDDLSRILELLDYQAD